MGTKLNRARARAHAQHAQLTVIARGRDYFCNETIVLRFRVRDLEARLDAANRECSRLRDDLANAAASKAPPRYFLTPEDLHDVARHLPPAVPDTGENAAARPKVFTGAIRGQRDVLACERVSVRLSSAPMHNTLAYQLPSGIVIVRDEEGA